MTGVPAQGTPGVPVLPVSGVPAGTTGATGPGAAGREPLVDRIEGLATEAWNTFSQVAMSDRGAAAMLAVDADGWSVVAHLVAAERALVRASRALHGAAPAAPGLETGEVPVLGPEPSPLLQLTWLCRAARRLAREVAGVALRRPTTPVPPPTAAARLAGPGPGLDGRLAQVAHRVDEAEAHLGRARGALGPGGR